MFIEVTALGASSPYCLHHKWEKAVKLTLNTSQIIRVAPVVFENWEPKTSLTFREGYTIMEYFLQETKEEIDAVLHARSAGNNGGEELWYMK
jgi:hypothetical protein